MKTASTRLGRLREVSTSINTRWKNNELFIAAGVMPTLATPNV